MQQRGDNYPSHYEGNDRGHDDHCVDASAKLRAQTGEDVGKLLFVTIFRPPSAPGNAADAAIELYLAPR